ncbi:MAG: DUF4097 family beta strand repeat-containing protein [Oscillospiraceae bacterium]|nr:DUF4097 family beta strand repeat-containing protein [Oscillospiraceae bacterium]
MRTAAIIRIVCWSIVIVVLAGIVFMGVNGGFSYFDLPFISIGNPGFEGTVSTTGSESVNAADISNIEIDWTAGKVGISAYDGSEIKFTQTSNRSIEDKDRMVYKVEAGKLRVRDGDGQRKYGFISFGNKNSTDLTMWIPANIYLSALDVSVVSASASVSGVTLGRINIDGVSGGITVYNIISEEARFDTVSGEITAEGIEIGNLKSDSVSGSAAFYGTMKKLNYSSVSGAVKLEGSVNEARCDTTSGSVEISSSVCPGYISASTVSGSVTIAIPDNDGFTLSYDKVSGSLSNDFPTTESGGRKIYGNGSADFNIDTVSGGLNIRKLG